MYPLSVGPRAETTLYCLDVPSEKLLIASLEGESARYFSVTLGSPSLIIRWTIIRALNTIVHVESLRRFCNARKISATPASPACVATNICSTYLAFGGASWQRMISSCIFKRGNTQGLALILVPPFTDFSNEPDMAATDSYRKQSRRSICTASHEVQAMLQIDLL